MGYYYYCYRHWRMGRYRCRWWYKLWHCWFWLHGRWSHIL